jgi:hypothetical protein
MIKMIIKEKHTFIYALEREREENKCVRKEDKKKYLKKGIP